MWDKKARLLLLDGTLPCMLLYESPVQSIPEAVFMQITACTKRRMVDTSRLAPLRTGFMQSSCMFLAVRLRDCTDSTLWFLSKNLSSALSKLNVRGRNGKLLHEQMPLSADQYDSSKWPALRAFLAEAFASRTRDEWEAVFLDTDSCVAPVLEPEEAVKIRGTPIPKPAPQLVRTPATIPQKDLTCQLIASGRDTMSVLSELGISDAEARRLEAAGDVEQHKGKTTSRAPSKL